MTSTATVTLSHTFADALPELSLPWTAAEAPAPRLLALNEPLARELGLDPSYLWSDEGLGLLLGTRPPEGAVPVAQGYAGHQFGGYAPRLGDGRALLLGELSDAEGQSRDLHLKGSGRTPFSRGGDGLAALAPMLREYVLCEAMHALGIRTTRALAVTGTGATVRREVPAPGAVLARVASSHLRVGSFQYARALDDTDLLRRLADHAIARHHPALAAVADPAERYLALYGEVVAAQADLVARWMLVGFVHGVMNTDNMTISGETIDYGPCAFLDVFDPAAVFSSIDEGGRYAYGNQPTVAEWNLARLAEAMLPLLHEEQDQAVTMAVGVLEGFRSRYSAAWSAGMRAKLGLSAVAGGDGARADDRDGNNGDDRGGDEVASLVDGVHELIRGQADHTRFFRALSTAARGDAGPARDQVLDVAAFDAWAERWRALGPDPVAMDRVNPVYVPRNHLVEEALAAALAGDLTPFERLNDVLAHPFTERPGLERYAEPAPESFGPYTTYCGT